MKPYLAVASVLALQNSCPLGWSLGRGLRWSKSVWGWWWMEPYLAVASVLALPNRCPLRRSLGRGLTRRECVGLPMSGAQRCAIEREDCVATRAWGEYLAMWVSKPFMWTLVIFLFSCGVTIGGWLIPSLALIYLIFSICASSEETDWNMILLVSIKDILMTLKCHFIIISIAIWKKCFHSELFQKYWYPKVDFYFGATPSYTKEAYHWIILTPLSSTCKLDLNKLPTQRLWQLHIRSRKNHLASQQYLSYI